MMWHLKSLLRKILKRFGILPAKKIVRNDEQRIDIQPHLYFLVYWKVLSIGKGPAITLNAHDKEILKFDCFGKSDGHYHIHPFGDLRIFFVEENASTQCERAYNIIVQHAERYLKLYPERAINKMSVDQNKLKLAAKQAQEIMCSFLSEKAELKGL